MTKDSNQIKVFVTRDIPGPGIDLLKGAGFDVSVWFEDRPMKPEELMNAGAKANAMLNLLTDRIDKNFLKQCRHLEVISQYAVGYDNIDIGEATKLGIPIGYAPGAMSDVTADVAFGLMIAVS